jgi:predicted nucleotidyltransferase component of viral defense system
VFYEVLSDDLGRLLTEALQSVDTVHRRFYLAGGTALALQLGHRKSEDLDFFCPDDFESEQLTQDILSLGGMIVTEGPGTIHASVGSSKLSFFRYSYPLLGNTRTIGNIRVASIEDIACIKVIAIAQRAEKKDFFDVYEILKRISPSSLRDLVLRKYGDKRVNCYHVVRSFFYFDEAERSLDPVSLNDTTWEQVKSFFLSNENELTQGLCKEVAE